MSHLSHLSRLAAAAAVVAAAVGGCSAAPARFTAPVTTTHTTTVRAATPVPSPAPTTTPSTPTTTTSSAGSVGKVTAKPAPPRNVLADLAALPTIKSRPEVPGYSRDQFGSPWTDRTTAPGGGNGCATNVDVYAAQLTAQTSRRQGRCQRFVTAGTLVDPYTGRSIEYVRGQRPVRVDIDHVIPLSRAWDMGAALWSEPHRERFANDVALNLIAVSASANRSKGDQGPDTWMPATCKGAQLYATKYVQVAKAYRLPVTTADRDSLHTALTAKCPR